MISWLTLQILKLYVECIRGELCHWPENREFTSQTIFTVVARPHTILIWRAPYCTGVDKWTLGTTQGETSRRESSLTRSGLAHRHLQLQSQKLPSHDPWASSKAGGVLAPSPQIMQKRKPPALFHLRHCSKRAPLSRIVHLYLDGCKQDAGSIVVRRRRSQAASILGLASYASVPHCSLTIQSRTVQRYHWVAATSFHLKYYHLLTPARIATCYPESFGSTCNLTHMTP